jgi:hypothetical protein
MHQPLKRQRLLHLTPAAAAAAAAAAKRNIKDAKLPRRHKRIQPMH